MLNWESLQTACLSCTSCPLSQTRHNVVFGVGPQDAEVMFVGEGPGENEDLQGEPFVGAAGKFLDEMLSIIDLGRENCYITNIVKCRPPKNRDPMQTEQDACISFLRAQTKLIQPKIIVCLGRIAAMRLIRPRSCATKASARTPFLTSRPFRPKSARSVPEPCNDNRTRRSRMGGRLFTATPSGTHGYKARTTCPAVQLVQIRAVETSETDAFKEGGYHG